MSTATTGTLSFSSGATDQSPPGFYAIVGSGLTANNGNYVFVQAPGNRAALTLDPSPSNPPSQFTAFEYGPPATSFDLPDANAAPVQISFTPELAPGATLSLDAGLSFNHGFDFQPVSQYDASQYSQFKLPDYDDKDSEATLFTIIASRSRLRLQD